MQSFHAIFLVFIMEIISFISISETMDTWSSNDGILAIISMVAIMSLIKMEKMIKGIFGMKDSKFMGNIGENFAKGMAGIRSAGSMAKRTVEPAKRVGKLGVDKVRNLKDIKDAKDNVNKSKDALAEKQKNARDKEMEVARIKRAGPGKGASEEEREAYNDRLKEARKEAKEAQNKVQKAKDDLSSAQKDKYVKINKGKKIDADLKVASVQAGTTIGSTVAASAFGVGATDSLSEAAILANMTDKPLDAIADRVTKNTVYGKAARSQQKYIDELPERMARDKVRAENPNLTEGSAAFENKVKIALDDVEFKKQIQTAVQAAMDTKFEMDLEIPKSTFKQLGKAMGDTWKEGATAFSSESRAGRAYSKSVRKDGIRYKGTNIDDVGDI